MYLLTARSRFISKLVNCKKAEAYKNGPFLSRRNNAYYIMSNPSDSKMIRFKNTGCVSRQMGRITTSSPSMSIRNHSVSDNSIGNIGTKIEPTSLDFLKKRNDQKIAALARNFVTVTKTSASSIDSVEKKQDEFHSNSDDDTGVVVGVHQDNYVILVTPSAVRQIDYLAKRKNPTNPNHMFLRVYVDAGGCSGFQYKFEMDQEEHDDESKDYTGHENDSLMSGIDPEEDVVIQCTLLSEDDDHGAKTQMDEKANPTKVRVVIDQASLDLMKGCKVDFVTEMIRSSFAIVDNPQSESACGCGSSFAVKNFEANPAVD